MVELDKFASSFKLNEIHPIFSMDIDLDPEAQPRKESAMSPDSPVRHSKKVLDSELVGKSLTEDFLRASSERLGMLNPISNSKSEHLIINLVCCRFKSWIQAS